MASPRKLITQVFYFGNGFTFVEILTVLFIAGIIALPFTKMFHFGKKGSIDNLEHITAYNLAREKMEEIKSLPFELIKSDFENFHDIYSDSQEFGDAFGSPAAFEKCFTDIFTESSLKEEIQKELYQKFIELYKKTYLRDYNIYPEELSGYRRVTLVDDRGLDKVHPSRLKKVIVRVFDTKGHKLAELTTLIGKHK